MTRERLVVNVKGGKFCPRAIFFDLHSTPPPASGGGGTGTSGTSMARQDFLSIFLARAVKSI